VRRTPCLQNEETALLAERLTWSCGHLNSRSLPSNFKGFVIKVNLQIGYFGSPKAFRSAARHSPSTTAGPNLPNVPKVAAAGYLIAIRQTL
jgi:hypothetical protein